MEHDYIWILGVYDPNIRCVFFFFFCVPLFYQEQGLYRPVFNSSMTADGWMTITYIPYSVDILSIQFGKAPARGSYQVFCCSNLTRLIGFD